MGKVAANKGLIAASIAIGAIGGLSYFIRKKN
jgi:hypothetical protein